MTVNRPDFSEAESSASCRRYWAGKRGLHDRTRQPYAPDRRSATNDRLRRHASTAPPSWLRSKSPRFDAKRIRFDDALFATFYFSTIEDESKSPPSTWWNQTLLSRPKCRMQNRRQWHVDLAPDLGLDLLKLNPDQSRSARCRTALSADARLPRYATTVACRELPPCPFQATANFHLESETLEIATRRFNTARNIASIRLSSGLIIFQS